MGGYPPRTFVNSHLKLSWSAPFFFTAPNALNCNSKQTCLTHKPKRVIADKMSATAIATVAAEEKYEDMSATDILKQMKEMMKVLEKKTKTAETRLSKLEAKEEKRAASKPEKGVLPKKLDATHSWVNFVHAHMIEHGWEGFIHKERCGKGMAEIAMPESESVLSVGADGAPVSVRVFKGVEPYSQPNLSHAMNVSAKYKTEKPELYAEWQASYVAPAAEEPAATAAVAAKPAPVAMTLAEKLAMKEKAAAEKKAAADAKKAERAAKKAEKEAEAAAAKAVRAAAKPSKGPKAAVLRALVPAAAKPALLAAVSKPATPVAAVSKPASPVAVKPIWVPLADDTDVAKWVVNGVTYLRNNSNYLYECIDGDFGEPVGQYHPEDDTIDTSVGPQYEDEE